MSELLDRIINEYQFKVNYTIISKESNSMTKRELAEQISLHTEGQFSTAECEEFINAFSHCVIQAVENKKTVYLRGFGKFTTKTRKTKKVQDMHRGITMQMPETVIPAFIPYDTFREKVNAK